MLNTKYGIVYVFLSIEKLMYTALLQFCTISELRHLINKFKK